jgi:hypothetical protein
MRRIPFSFWGIVFSTACAPVALQAELQVGQEAPDFTEMVCDGNGLTGGQFRLSADGAGKIVFLQFNNPTCGRCVSTTTMVEEQVYPLYAGNPDVIFVQIAYAYGPYTVDDVVSFIQETGCTQTVIAECDGSAYAAYGISGIPYIYMIDKGGVIRYSQKGYTGAGPINAEELIAAMNALLGGNPLPTPATVPCLQIACNADAYSPGSWAKIQATVTAVNRPFDAYALVRKPDGSYISMTLEGKTLEGVVPLAVGVPSHPSSVCYTLLDTTLPGGTAPGMYQIIVALAAPGTMNAFCEAEVTRPVR